MKYTIHLKNDTTYTCDENTSLLKAALDNDISLEYSCFEARCRSCRVKVLEGEVENLPLKRKPQAMCCRAM